MKEEAGRRAGGGKERPRGPRQQEEESSNEVHAGTRRIRTSEEKEEREKDETECRALGSGTYLVNPRKQSRRARGTKCALERICES